ncbi:transcriptional regulator with XRE-family HTH domain [Roseospira marina]|nr:transcriptional regulator with XRE-family HTH domain [Roseospira marina]MBB5089034.1 transcriptional regulator with XRE-family HTH domain [Roseospira marina]
MGVSRSAYQRYEAGTRSPKLRHLQGLAKVGVNIHWLLTGEDEAALQSAYAAGTPNPDHLREPARPTSLDGDLMGRIVDTIRAVYKAEGQAIPDRSLGELAAEWYGTITSQAAGPGDRLDALAEHQIALRRRLRAATTHPTSDKRPA